MEKEMLIDVSECLELESAMQQAKATLAMWHKYYYPDKLIVTFIYHESKYKVKLP